MSKVEVLVASVNTNPIDLYKRMNLNSNTVIANQTNYNAIDSYSINNNRVKVISTTTRGVGINRNLGLLFSDSKYILFADDDNVYINNYADIVVQAFDNLPKADVIVFQLKYIKQNKIISEDNYKIKRRHLWNSLSFGAPKIAIRTSALKKRNISFSTLFGGGSLYGSGEDSIFICDCLKNKLKVYTYNKTIAENICDSSSWFSGFNEKYFFDKGAFIASSFGWFMKHLLVLYFVFRFINIKEISSIKKFKLLYSGLRAYSHCITYSEWLQLTNIGNKNEK